MPVGGGAAAAPAAAAAPVEVRTRDRSGRPHCGINGAMRFFLHTI
jgi:hypothetical protein